jgi:alpha-L-fucosidase
VFDDHLIDFERMPLDGRLQLNEGGNTIALRIETLAAPPLRLRSIELMPVAAQQDIQRESADARAKRANTGWLAKAGYGLMFHWTSQSQPRSGPQKPYAIAVKEFDVPAFGNMVAETGASYVLFTVNHADPHCPAPIRSWERIHPGMTTERDLIGDIAAELAQRKIRLMLYFASHTLGRLNKATAEEYEQTHRDVLTEIGNRYGGRISGYWFDGWYQSLQAYPEISMERMWKLVKTGNRNRLVAYNFWVYPVETVWQDYWAAEVGGIVNLADGRFPSNGPGKGLQYQNLIMADAPWVHSKPDSEMEPPHFSNDRLIEFVKGCMAREGAVTINLGIYQDGKIGEATLKQMVGLRKAIRGR